MLHLGLKISFNVKQTVRIETHLFYYTFNIKELIHIKIKLFAISIKKTNYSHFIIMIIEFKNGILAKSNKNQLKADYVEGKIGSLQI